MTLRHALAYTLIITANAMLVAFEALLVAGKVPLPAAVGYLTPCLVAGLTVLTTQLPKLVSAPVVPSAPVAPGPGEAALVPHPMGEQLPA